MRGRRCVGGRQRYLSFLPSETSASRELIIMCRADFKLGVLDCVHYHLWSDSIISALLFILIWTLTLLTGMVTKWNENQAWSQVLFIMMRIFVTSGFCSTDFTATSAGLKSIIRYARDFVLRGFVILEFHCITIMMTMMMMLNFV